MRRTIFPAIAALAFFGACAPTPRPRRPNLPSATPPEVSKIEPRAWPANELDPARERPRRYATAAPSQ